MQSDKEDKISFLTESEETADRKSITWILDSGSTSHMVNNKKILKEIQWKESEIGIAKKEEKMKAKGIGKIVTQDCVLNNILFVPDLSKNLLSVSAIVQNGGQVVFAKHGAEIKKDGKRFAVK